MEKQKIERRPAKPRKVLSEAVRYYLLSLIPKGRIITWEGLRAFVSKKLGIDIEFEERYEDRLKNINFFSVKKNNDYKEVSKVGNTGWFEKELLEKEGFELYKSTKYLYKVKDYTKYLFDFEKETTVTAEQILEIDKIGLSYLFNIENCIRKDA